MKKKNIIIIIAVIAAAAAAAAFFLSKGDNKFHVKGNVAGAADTTRLVLEFTNDGFWYVLDTLSTTAGGDFSFEAEAPQFPNIYRLRHGADAIYFPIDSIDHLVINTRLSDFATAYTVQGSDHAVQVMNIDKRAMQFARDLAAARDEAATTKVNAAIDQWKHQLADSLDFNSIVSYYLINKQLGDRPLFDPTRSFDLKIIGAVATGYKTFRPNDPRTHYMERQFIEAQRLFRRGKVATDTIQAGEVSLLNISLHDKQGQLRDLTQVASGGKLVVLNFTILDADFSPMLNKLLNDVYTKHKGQNMEIFQVCFDANQADWMRLASNLPWVVVRDPMSVQSHLITTYNLAGVPTTFIIGRNGEIVERVDDVTQLENRLARYL